MAWHLSMAQCVHNADMLTASRSCCFCHTWFGSAHCRTWTQPAAAASQRYRKLTSGECVGKGIISNMRSPINRTKRAPPCGSSRAAAAGRTQSLPRLSDAPLPCSAAVPLAPPRPRRAPFSYQQAVSVTCCKPFSFTINSHENAPSVHSADRWASALDASLPWALLYG